MLVSVLRSAGKRVVGKVFESTRRGSVVVLGTACVANSARVSPDARVVHFPYFSRSLRGDTADFSEGEGGIMSLSKKTRFEIFKRDGFTCQYCGQRPPDVVLEVDHIEPKSKGGSDEEINLITSCYDCNRGKSDRKLGDVHPRPDADLKTLETQQEIAEARMYLRTQDELSNLRAQIKKRLIGVWNELYESDFIPNDNQWSNWLSRFSPEEVEFAVRRTAPKYQGGQFGKWNDDQRKVAQAIRYVSGILNRRREEANAQTPD
jgi:5-methylcytosine-specific restriction endonuclease McrA